MYKKKSPFFYSMLSVIVLALLCYVTLKSLRELDYDWDFSVLIPFLWDKESHAPGLLFRGLFMTLFISTQSIFWGTVLGTIVGILLTVREPIMRTAALLYTDILRNTPLLVQLYLVYFVVGTSYGLSAEQAGIMTLSVFCSAHIADLVRGTLVNFDKGQLDAARTMGLSSWQTARIVVFPQALRRLTPALVGQFVSLVKDSSLVSVIAIAELTKAAQNVVSVSFKSFETWFVVAGFYLIINSVLSSAGRYLEHRLLKSHA